MTAIPNIMATLSLNKKLTALWRAGLLGIGLSLSTGCTDTPKKFEQISSTPAGMGVIYFYRLPESGSRNISGTLIANGNPIASISNGNYIPYIVNSAPLTYEIITNNPPQNLTSKARYKIEPGQERFVRLQFSGDRLRFNPVFSESAKQAISACTLADSMSEPQKPLPVVQTPSPKSVKIRHPAPSSALKPGPQLRQGTFSFEAEKLALENGCTTRDGVRPSSFLVEQNETFEIYEVSCETNRMIVGCQFQYCQLMR